MINMKKCPMKIMLCQMIHVSAVTWRTMLISNISRFKSSLSKHLTSCEKNVLHWILLHWWSWKILFIMHRKNIRSIFTSSCRKHDTDICVILEGYSCSECKDFLYQIMPCNVSYLYTVIQGVVKVFLSMI